MAEPNAISELQAVDFAMGGVLVGAYDGLADERPEAFRRFLARPAKEKIFRAENEDPLSLLRRIARRGGSDGRPVPDLPVIAYYRAPGLAGGMEKPVALSVDRWTDDLKRGLRLSVIPVTLSYSLLWCAWDKPTLDKLTLAWFCYVAQRGRRNSRFVVPYLVDGELLEVPASLSAPRDIQADDANVGQGHLWAARTLAEVSTQVLYGRRVELVDEIKVLGMSRIQHTCPTGCGVGTCRG